ncbi:MAG: 30S ribosomal protein S16 [Candidatus Omnitrophica bacterium]|nr:30S ribosomal protein S16 [Candidatus Omnitrophota bacterium]
MVIIRLQRRGTKKTPDHRIVVADKAHSQAGRVLETLGYYNPAYEPPKLTLNESRLTYWVSTGAQISPAVTSLVKRIKKTAATTRA